MRRMLCFRLTTQTIVLIFSLALVVHADEAKGLFKLMSGSFNAKARDVRTQLARDALTELNRFSDLLQIPRPSDVAWVETEQAAIRQLTDAEAATSRRIQLYQSPEFQHVKVHNYLQEIQSSFRCVMEPDPTLQREMFCWASAAFLLGDKSVFKDGVRILHRAKRLPDNTVKGASPGYDSLDFLYEAYSRGIQEYLILPYLRGDLK